MAAGIELVGLTKRFGHGPISGTTGSGTTGGHAAVDNIDLSVSGGEFFSLLGPSGCAKTTTLRLIAGFEEPTAGRILLDGVDVSQMPSHKRNVYTVFQSYATILPLRPSKASCQLKSLQSLGFDARGRSAGDAFS